MLRNPTTLPSSDILIEDLVLDPYFITNSVSSGGYTVYERVTRGDKDTDYLRTVCYPSTFNFALKVIAKEKLSRGANTHYKSLKEYVETWETITKSIENATLIEL
jgi:hypothetical protein